MQLIILRYGSIFEEISRIRQWKRVPHRGAPWVVPFSKHNSERIQKDGYSAAGSVERRNGHPPQNQTLSGASPQVLFSHLL